MDNPIAPVRPQYPSNFGIDLPDIGDIAYRVRLIDKIEGAII
jgi:hypothetical protein